MLVLNCSVNLLSKRALCLNTIEEHKIFNLKYNFNKGNEFDNTIP